MRRTMDDIFLDNLELIQDLCRYAENLLSEQQVRKKYRFDNETWECLGSNDSLVEAIEAEKTRRIRNGSTARERAQQHFASAPTVLGGILNDDGHPGTGSKVRASCARSPTTDRKPHQRRIDLSFTSIWVPTRNSRSISRANPASMTIRLLKAQRHKQQS